MTTSSPSSTDAALQEAVSAINDQAHGFDVTIICTTDDHQATYWMDLLEHGLLRHRKVLAVSEDWNSSGGAGNGLGTLYAFQKAAALAQTKYDGYDLRAALAGGSASAALYHTAGKGTRMAPLPASENNNKPGVVRAKMRGVLPFLRGLFLFGCLFGTLICPFRVWIANFAHLILIND